MVEKMTADDAKLFRETHEALIALGAKLDAFDTRMGDDRIRLLKLEALFEIERVKIATFESMIPVVFGAAGHAVGLVEKVSNLELRAVTWPQVAALASFCGVLSSVAATVTMFLARGAW